MAEDRPRWREDFPVRWDEDHYVTRRELAKFLTLGSGLLAGVNVLIAFIGLNERIPTTPVQRIAGRRRHSSRRFAAVPISDGGRPLHSGARPLGQARCVSRRSARICRARSCIGRTSGRWRVRATRDRSPPPTASRWPDRRRGACRAS